MNSSIEQFIPSPAIQLEVLYVNSIKNNKTLLLGCFCDVAQVCELLGVSHTFLKGRKKTQTSQRKCSSSEQDMNSVGQKQWESKN